jgi:hypothetical protein
MTTRGPTPSCARPSRPGCARACYSSTRTGRGCTRSANPCRARCANLMPGPRTCSLRPGGQVTVIDWSFAGDGAIGEDARNPGARCRLRALHRRQRPARPGAGRLRRWLAALTLAQVRNDRQHRYGGAGEIDPVFKFHERSRVLLFNAGWARQAVALADRRAACTLALCQPTTGPSQRSKWSRPTVSHTSSRPLASPAVRLTPIWARRPPGSKRSAAARKGLFGVAVSR